MPAFTVSGTVCITAKVNRLGVCRLGLLLIPRRVRDKLLVALGTVIVVKDLAFLEVRSIPFMNVVQINCIMVFGALCQFRLSGKESQIQICEYRSEMN